MEFIGVYFIIKILTNVLELEIKMFYVLYLISDKWWSESSKKQQNRIIVLTFWPASSGQTYIVGWNVGAMNS